ncbi:MAG: hypothetical protein Q9160_003243 [Pyrenula sp. 1 TL-2023]
MLITSKQSSPTAPDFGGYGEDSQHKPSGWINISQPNESKHSDQPVYATMMQHWFDQPMSDGPFAIVDGQSTRHFLQQGPNASPLQIAPQVPRCSNSIQAYNPDKFADQARNLNQTEAHNQAQGIPQAYAQSRPQAHKQEEAHNQPRASRKSHATKNINKP